MRIYGVEYAGQLRLVIANHRYTALRHVAEEVIKVRIPNQIEVAQLVGAGVRVESATESNDPAPEIPLPERVERQDDEQDPGTGV